MSRYKGINGPSSLSKGLEALHGLIFADSPLVMAAIGADGRVGAWNARAEQVLGVDSGEIEGKSVFDFPLPWDRQKVNGALRACLDFGEPVSLDRAGFRTTDGAEGLLRMNFQPINDGKRRVGVLLQASDETECSTLESRLLADMPFATIGKLAPGIAHEINNPVSFIGNNVVTLGQYLENIRHILGEGAALAAACASTQGTVGEMARELNEDWRALDLDGILDDLEGLIGETLEGVERIRLIALGLKEFSKTDDMPAKAIDINTCLDRTLAFAWNEVKYKARVEKRYGELPMYRCRPDEIRQVFLQLLLKIAVSIEQYCDIAITTRSTGDALVVEFSISGGEENARRCRVALAAAKKADNDKGWHLANRILFDHRAKLCLDDENVQGHICSVSFPLEPVCALVASNRLRPTE